MSDEIKLIDGSSRSFKEVFTLSEGKYKMIDIKEEYRKKIRNVYIPEYVTKIDKRALLCCTSLRKLTLPSEAFPFDEDTLYGCDKLTYIKIYKSGDGKIKTYKNKECNIFGNYKNKTIRNIILDGIVSIPKFAFSCCESLNTVFILAEIKKIPNHAFCCCFSLKDVKMQQGIKEIGDYAFYLCKELESIRLPNTVTSIKKGAFRECSKLKTIYSLNSDSYMLSDIGKDSDLRKANIPNSLEEIGDEAFYGCFSLAFIYISTEVTKFYNDNTASNHTLFSPLRSIGEKAFFCCSSLRTATIPKTVKSVGEYAFSQCKDLESIDVEEGNKVYSSIDGVLCKNIENGREQYQEIIKYPEGKAGIEFFTEFIIPDSVKHIGENAFGGSTFLQRVIIPKEAESIGKGAFFDCSSLEEIYIDEREEDSPLRYKTCDWCENKKIIRWRKK